MSVWLALALLFWILAIINHAMGNRFCTVFAFFDGLLLSFLCFKLLPETFVEPFFWLGTVGLLAGAVVGSALEVHPLFHEPMNSSFWHGAVFTVSILLFSKGLPIAGQGRIAVFLLSFLGGFFLSVACGGILPEQDSVRFRAIAGVLGAAGFMLGTCYLYVY